MASLQTTQPTIYSMEPRAFLLQDSAAWQSATNPVNVDLVKIRKGTVVVRCWVDVPTATGQAGTCLLMRYLAAGTRDGGSDGLATIMSFDGNATAITPGPITATGYDPWTGDGYANLRKVGTGALAVFSVYMLLLRPNMNP